MTELTLSTAPSVNVQMLIRAPAAKVFEAFVNPDITTKFWFTRSDGPLEVGKPNRFYFDMYGVSGPVEVIAVDQNKRILIEWGEDPHKSTVEWIFEARPDDTTLVKISNAGFAGNGDELVAQAIDSMGGFAMLLAGAKAWLEHGIQLNLTGDSYPDGHH